MKIRSTATIAALLASALLASGASPVFAETPESTPDTSVIAEPTVEAPADEVTKPTEETAPVESEQPDQAADPLENSEVLESEPAVEDAWAESEAAGGPAARGVANGTLNLRIQGADRFATAAAISKHTYPSSSRGTVVIATGANFPDSLSAAPLATKRGGPLLLTMPDALPAATSAEVQRLNPATVLIIGSTSSVSAAVESQLQASGRTVKRIQGADRYESSVAIAKAGWSSASNVFVATGTGYADALSAGAAATRVGGPVVLVPGVNSTAPASTKALLTSLGTSRLYVAGSGASVSDAMVSSLKSAGPQNVTRYAGVDRFDTSAKIANAHFTTTTTTYWATGYGFADALAGAAAAGRNGAPLLLALPNCIPTTIYDANDARRPSNTYLLGSSGALSDSVLYGNECMNRPAGMTNVDFAGTQQVYSMFNKYRYDRSLQGARLADAKVGYSAFNWSNYMAANNVFKLDPNLGTKQPWVAQEYVLKDPTAQNGSAAASFNYMAPRYPGAITYAQAGKRTSVSIGWMNRSNTAWFTVHTGVR